MFKRLQYITLVGLIMLIIFLTGCSDKTSDTGIDSEKQVEQNNNKEQVNPPQPEEPQKPEVDLAQIKANEAGEIVVLMYHSIAEPEGEFRRTPENLRKDLQYLYDKGYRPISLVDYVTGNITTEAGYTPIVLTFDDGWQDNFNIIDNGQGQLLIDENSAVGILEDFHKNHPDFPLEATFFVNDNIPFGQKEHLEYKLKYLVEKGMDIGNHTATHVNFTSIDADRIQKEIAAIAKMINGYLPNYQVETLSLPFGSRPKDEALYTYLEKGSFNGTGYKNIAILNVGWDPYKSPYHKDFNPLSIHRVRASDLQKYVQGVGMYDWFKRYENGQRKRYISDGDPDTVAIPETQKDLLDESKIGNKELKIYELKTE